MGNRERLSVVRRKVLGQLGRRAKHFKSPENPRFIVQEILNYTLISRKS